MALAPWVDEERCTGCGLCVDKLPKVFHLTCKGKARCYDADGATEQQIHEDAVKFCPVRCIFWASMAYN